jgi:hypothetical protein
MAAARPAELTARTLARIMEREIIIDGASLRVLVLD